MPPPSLRACCGALCLLALWNALLATLLESVAQGGLLSPTAAAALSERAAATAAELSRAQVALNVSAALLRTGATAQALRLGGAPRSALRSAGIYDIEDEARRPRGDRFNAHRVPPSSAANSSASVALRSRARVLVLGLRHSGAATGAGASNSAASTSRTAAAASIVDEWLTRDGAAYRIVSEPVAPGDAAAWVLTERPPEEARVLLAVEAIQHPRGGRLACDASRTVSSWMWSSGYVADVSHAADGLAHALQHDVHFAIKTHVAQPWRVAAASAAGGAANRACPAADFSCFFLALSTCAPGDPDRSPVVDSRWVTLDHASFPALAAGTAATMRNASALALPSGRRRERVNAGALAPAALRVHPTLSPAEWLRFVLAEHVARPAYWVRRAVARVVRLYEEHGFGAESCGVVRLYHHDAPRAGAPRRNLSELFSAQLLAPLRAKRAVLFLTDSVSAAHDAAALLRGVDAFGTAASARSGAGAGAGAGTHASASAAAAGPRSLRRSAYARGGSVVPAARRVFTISPRTPSIAAAQLRDLVEPLHGDAPAQRLSPVAAKLRASMVWRLATLELASRCDVLVVTTPSRDADLLYYSMCRGAPPAVGAGRAWLCPPCTVAGSALLGGEASSAFKVLSACARRSSATTPSRSIGAASTAVAATTVTADNI